MWLFGFVGAKIKAAVAGVLAAGVILLMVFQRGKTTERKAQELDGLRDYKGVREKLDEIDNDLDRSARIERLRSNGAARKD